MEIRQLTAMCTLWTTGKEWARTCVTSFYGCGVSDCSLSMGLTNDNLSAASPAEERQVEERQNLLRDRTPSDLQQGSPVH